MSKTIVSKALELAADGNLEDAVKHLEGVSRTYASKRLTSYLATSLKPLHNLVIELASAANIPLKAPSGAPPADIEQAAKRWVISDAETLREGITQGSLAMLADPDINAFTNEVSLDITMATILEPFALAALGARARKLQEDGLNTTIRTQFDNPSNKFANALGLNALWTGIPLTSAIEEERTIALGTVRSYSDMEKFAQDVATRVCPDDPETRSATKYCLIELIRNVLDHSGSSATVCAQYMHAGKGARSHDGVQVAVADCGFGIQSTLASMHDWVTSDSIAMTAALSPFVSRTFPEGDFSQMKNNAGLGLYFIHELVKKSDGRMLLWSGDHARIVIGDTASADGVKEREIALPPYTGMLAAVEFQIGLIDDYDEFFNYLRERIYSLIQIGKEGGSVLERLPVPEPGIQVGKLAEDTAAARKFRIETLLPKVHSENRVVLDFSEYKYLSPSFAHALMHETIREAALSNTSLCISGAADAVWNILRQVQRYALAGTTG